MFRKNQQKKQQSSLHVIRDLPGCVYWKDLNGAYLGCNKIFLEMVGLNSEEEVIGKTDYDFSWKGDADSLRQHDAFILQSGKVQSLEEEVTLISGERRLYSVVKAPLFNKNQKKIIGIVGTSIDITERRNLEQSLAEAEIREVHLKAMSSIGGMIAHELRTPLAAIELAAKSIKKFFPPLVEAYREYSKTTQIKTIREGYLNSLENTADNIEQSAQYASNTIRTILTGFHYVTSEKVKMEEADVNAIVQQALADYPLSEEERALITFHPKGVCKALVSHEIIIHVLHNLLKNALYAIQAVNKGIITITVEKTKNHIQLTFKDTAKGIPEDILEHIFEPFYTTKDIDTSIGLGLYFCKMALEKTNASITCESKLSEYTTFKIKFNRLSLKSQ